MTDNYDDLETQIKSMGNVLKMQTDDTTRNELIDHICQNGLIIDDNMTVLPYFLRYKDKKMYKISAKYGDEIHYYTAYVKEEAFVIEGLCYKVWGENVLIITYTQNRINLSIDGIRGNSLKYLIKTETDDVSMYHLLEAIFNKNFVLNSTSTIVYEDSYSKTIFADFMGEFMIEKDGTRLYVSDDKLEVFIKKTETYSSDTKDLNLEAVQRVYDMDTDITTKHEIIWRIFQKGLIVSPYVINILPYYRTHKGNKMYKLMCLWDNKSCEWSTVHIEGSHFMENGLYYRRDAETKEIITIKSTSSSQGLTDDQHRSLAMLIAMKTDDISMHHLHEAVISSDFVIGSTSHLKFHSTVAGNDIFTNINHEKFSVNENGNRRYVTDNAIEFIKYIEQSGIEIPSKKVDLTSVQRVSQMDTDDTTKHKIILLIYRDGLFIDECIINILPYYRNYGGNTMYKLKCTTGDLYEYSTCYVLNNNHFEKEGLVYYQDINTNETSMMRHTSVGVLSDVQIESLKNLIDMHVDNITMYHLQEAVLNRNFIIKSGDSFVFKCLDSDSSNSGIFLDKKINERFFIKENGAMYYESAIEVNRIAESSVFQYQGALDHSEPDSIANLEEVKVTEEVVELNTYGIDVPTGDELREVVLKAFIEDFVKNCTYRVYLLQGYICFNHSTPVYCVEWIKTYAKKYNFRFEEKWSKFDNGVAPTYYFYF